MSTEEQAQDIRDRMRSDMVKSLREQGITAHTVNVEALLDALVEDGMFQVEALLTKVEFHDGDRPREDDERG